MAVINFSHIDKIYPGNIQVIKDLNLEIKDNEFMILVGPSGCGKSTLLRMLAGLEEISGGELAIDGKVVNDVLPKDRDIAMVFQNYALYPHMSVYDNMAFALKLKKVPKDEIKKKVDAVADHLNLTEYLDRKPKALSGGQRQRVALGRAMVRSPKVFLLDEPLSNLDAKLRTEMRSRISALHKELNTTFVYVTHDQTEAMTMGDRIAVMKLGVIQQVDTPEVLYKDPVNVFVASFIGSPQMNMIDVLVTKKDGAYALTFEGNYITVPVGLQKAVEKYEGKEIILGIRPEHLFVSKAKADADTAAFETRVELVEMLGAESNIYFNLQQKLLVAKATLIESEGINRDDTVTMKLDTASLMLFDKESEQRIRA
ncbi:MAG: sn-glycerol-3-phosphate ABC transporter ATP-binding protein UgpC [Clostridiales Family XIII bacterium]|jgi:multiple sugar transport system ATP-binding protein|nr:sn-glycerol-3-phosphate ABC transporter ATP-binding protein UgpC [Clostridiales Family XIII bacterium]